MTVAEFLAWPGDGTGRRYQLIDGELRAMSPASTTHGSIQTNLAYELRQHSTRLLAELLRRDAQGHWPAEPDEIGPDGELRLASIAFACPLRAVYAQTHLA